MNHQFLGREGVLDDTKPTQHEAVYRKLKNNELEILKNNKAFYERIKQDVAQEEQE